MHRSAALSEFTVSLPLSIPKILLQKATSGPISSSLVPESQSSKGHLACLSTTLCSLEIVFKWDRMVLTLSKLVSLNIVFPGFLYIHILKLCYSMDEDFIIYAINIDMFRYDTHPYTPQAFNIIVTYISVYNWSSKEHQDSSHIWVILLTLLYMLVDKCLFEFFLEVLFCIEPGVRILDDMKTRHTIFQVVTLFYIPNKHMKELQSLHVSVYTSFLWFAAQHPNEDCRVLLHLRSPLIYARRMVADDNNCSLSHAS